jgi:hypothetical protein
VAYSTYGFAVHLNLGCFAGVEDRSSGSPQMIIMNKSKFKCFAGEAIRRGPQWPSGEVGHGPCRLTTARKEVREASNK